MDAEALERIFEEHYVRLVRLATHLLVSSEIAEEVVQEAFARMAAKRQTFTAIHNPVGYITSTVVNLSKDTRRRRALERRWSAEHLTRGEFYDYYPDLDLADALRALPARKRACVVLRYYEGMSEAETAKVLRISVGTVKSQTSRALRQMRSTLNAQSSEQEAPEKADATNSLLDKARRTLT